MSTDWQGLFDDFLECAYEDSEAEFRAYEIIAMFDEIESEICDFYDAMVHVFGGHVFFDPYGDSHYCDGSACVDCSAELDSLYHFDGYEHCVGKPCNCEECKQ